LHEWLLSNGAELLRDDHTLDALFDASGAWAVTLPDFSNGSITTRGITGPQVMVAASADVDRYGIAPGKPPRGREGSPVN